VGCCTRSPICSILQHGPRVRDAQRSCPLQRRNSGAAPSESGLQAVHQPYNILTQKGSAPHHVLMMTPLGNSTAPSSARKKSQEKSGYRLPRLGCLCLHYKLHWLARSTISRTSMRQEAAVTRTCPPRAAIPSIHDEDYPLDDHWLRAGHRQHGRTAVRYWLMGATSGDRNGLALPETQMTKYYLPTGRPSRRTTRTASELGAPRASRRFHTDAGYRTTKVGAALHDGPLPHDRHRRRPITLTILRASIRKTPNWIIVQGRWAESRFGRTRG